MSSTGVAKKDGTKTDRHASDFYETPEACVHRLLEQPEIFTKFPLGELLEPCAGNGSIIKAVRSFTSRNNLFWTAVELLPECETSLGKLLKPTEIRSEEIVIHGDQLVCPQDYLSWKPNRNFNTIITNPPFSLWQQFLEKSLDESKIVCYLLRLGVFGSKKRKSFWQKHKPAVYILSDRPSFTGDGKTDSDYYAWFCWNVGEPGTWKVI